MLLTKPVTGTTGLSELSRMRTSVRRKQQVSCTRSNAWKAGWSQPWGHPPDSDRHSDCCTVPVLLQWGNGSCRRLHFLGWLLGSSTIHGDSQGKEGDKRVATEILQQSCEGCSTNTHRPLSCTNSALGGSDLYFCLHYWARGLLSPGWKPAMPFVDTTSTQRRGSQRAAPLAMDRER